MDSTRALRNLVLEQSRRRRKLRDNILGITKPAIRRLARRGGIVRMKSDIYDEARRAIRDRLTEVVTTRDVIYALNRVSLSSFLAL
ncbi:hypothetical protein ABOM_007828 [Aspergillus bombycis]|uniref:Histone H4 n=1 Tax=Aspergillus bombycis TaxID=109264 RepID=A0A1F7ZVJ0_9EURO|nr:hypothetical protein ABOM_007828 [Aspergillus bombycis]OGM43471.1 hypothetical protein ABOM_007828 [Aspergillus bombycis]